MEDIKQLEKNVILSFDSAKEEIEDNKGRIRDLEKAYRKVLEVLDNLRDENDYLNRKLALVEEISEKPAEKVYFVEEPEVSKKVKKKEKLWFVASESGEIFHEINCPFAQQIKRVNRISFENKLEALKSGFKPCKCIK